MVTVCPHEPGSAVQHPVPKARQHAPVDQRPETLYLKPRKNDSLYLQLCKIQQLLNGNDPLAFASPSNTTDKELTLVVEPSEISRTPCPTDSHIITTTVSDIDSIQISNQPPPPLPYRQHYPIQSTQTITPSDSGSVDVAMRQRKASLKQQQEPKNIAANANNIVAVDENPFRPTPRHLRHFLVLVAKNSGLKAIGNSDNEKLPAMTSTPISSRSSQISSKSAAALHDLFGPSSTNPYSMHIIKQMPKLLARAIDETDDMELLSINELYNFNRETEVLERKCAELEQKFAVEERIKKGAETLMRLYAKHPKYNRPAANQYINAMKNQAVLMEQLVRHSKRIKECNRAHFGHNAAVLAMQLTKCEFERSILENRQKEIARRLGNLKVFFAYGDETDMTRDLIETKAELKHRDNDCDRLRRKCELLSDEIERLKQGNDGVAGEFPEDSLTAKEMAQMDFLYTELGEARDQAAAKQVEIDRLTKELKDMRANFDVLLRQNHAIGSYHEDQSECSADPSNLSTLSSRNEMRVLEETLYQLDTRNNSSNSSAMMAAANMEDKNVQSNINASNEKTSGEMEAMEKLSEAEQELEAIHEAFGIVRDPSSGAIGIIAAINGYLNANSDEFASQHSAQLRSTIEDYERQLASKETLIADLSHQLDKQQVHSQSEIDSLNQQLVESKCDLERLKGEYVEQISAMRQETELLRAASNSSVQQFTLEMQQTMEQMRSEHGADKLAWQQELDQTKSALHASLDQLADQSEMEQQLVILRSQLSQIIDEAEIQAAKWQEENDHFRTKFLTYQESLQHAFQQIRAATATDASLQKMTENFSADNFPQLLQSYISGVESKRKAYEQHLDDTLERIKEINDNNDQKEARLKSDYEKRISEVERSLQEILDEMQCTHQQALDKLRSSYSTKLIEAEQQCDVMREKLDYYHSQPTVIANEKLSKEFQELMNAFDDLSRKWTDSDATRRKQETLLVQSQKQIRELQSAVLEKEYQLKRMNGKSEDTGDKDSAFTNAMSAMKETYEQELERQRSEKTKLTDEVERLRRLCHMNNISED